MSVSQQQIEDLANYLINHPALPEIENRFWLRRLADVKVAETDEEIRKLKAMIDVHDEFMKEFRIVLDMAKNLGDQEE